MAKRPLGVTILAILAFLLGLLGLFGGLVALGFAEEIAEEVGIDVSLAIASVAGSIVIGIFYLVTGVGLWKLTMWGWTLGIVVSVVSIGRSVAEYFVFQNPFQPIFAIVVGLIIILYLLKVKPTFQAAQEPAAPPPPSTSE